MSWALSNNRFHSPKRWMLLLFTGKKQLHRVEETLLWVTQLVGGPSQDLEQKTVRPAGAHYLNLLRPQLPKCRPLTIHVRSRGPDEKGSAKDPHHRPISEMEKESSTKRGWGGAGTICPRYKGGGEVRPKYQKGKMAEAEACDAGAAACGDLYRRSSRTGPGAAATEAAGK